MPRALIRSWKEVEKVDCEGCGGKGYTSCYKCSGKGEWETSETKFNRLTGNYDTKTEKRICAYCTNPRVENYLKPGTVKCSTCKEQGFYYKEVEYKEERWRVKEKTYSVRDSRNVPDPEAHLVEYWRYDVMEEEIGDKEGDYWAISRNGQVVKYKEGRVKKLPPKRDWLGRLLWGDDD